MCAAATWSNYAERLDASRHIHTPLRTTVNKPAGGHAGSGGTHQFHVGGLVALGTSLVLPSVP